MHFNQKVKKIAEHALVSFKFLCVMIGVAFGMLAILYLITSFESHESIGFFSGKLEYVYTPVESPIHVGYLMGIILIVLGVGLLFSPLIADIFYKHWYSLTETDKSTLVKKRYYGSQSLNKMIITETTDDEIDRPIDQSPTKLMKEIAKCEPDDKHAIDMIIRDVFPGYRLDGFFYNRNSTAIYKDDFGQLFCKLRLVKIGSTLDRGYIEYNKLKIDPDTGEILDI